MFCCLWRNRARPPAAQAEQADDFEKRKAAAGPSGWPTEGRRLDFEPLSAMLRVEAIQQLGPPPPATRSLQPGNSFSGVISRRRLAEAFAEWPRGGRGAGLAVGTGALVYRHAARQAEQRLELTAPPRGQGSIGIEHLPEESPESAAQGIESIPGYWGPGLGLGEKRAGAGGGRRASPGAAAVFWRREMGARPKSGQGAPPPMGKRTACACDSIYTCPQS